MPNKNPKDIPTFPPGRTPERHRPDALATARRVGESITRIAAELDRLLHAAATEDDLTPIEARLLRLILEPQPQGNLARALGIDAPRTSQLTGNLEQRGLLRRQPGSGDQRRRFASLTPQGEAALQRISGRLTATSPLPKALSLDDLTLLTKLLDQVEIELEANLPPADERS